MLYGPSNYSEGGDWPYWKATGTLGGTSGIQGHRRIGWGRTLRISQTESQPWRRWHTNTRRPLTQDCRSTSRRSGIFAVCHPGTWGGFWAGGESNPRGTSNGYLSWVRGHHVRLENHRPSSQTFWNRHPENHSDRPGKLDGVRYGHWTPCCGPMGLRRVPVWEPHPTT